MTDAAADVRPDDNPYRPIADLADGHRFLGNLGSFWSDVFGGRDRLAAKAQADLTLLAQTSLDFLELIACLSRFTVPVWHRQNWYVLTIRETDRNAASVSPVTYVTGGRTYGDASLHYGDAAPVPRFRFPLPADFTQALQILNRPVHPSLVLSQGVDYRIDVNGRYVEFLNDPFKNPLFGTRSNVDGTAEIDLWCCGVSFDWHLIYEQFGYALNLYLKESTEHYRDLINAYWDALAGGPSVLTLRRGIAAACRLPLVREIKETVQHALLSPRALQVVTDRHVYDYPPTSTLADGVSVGATVYQGDLLTTAVQVFEAVDATSPAVAGLPGLAVGTNFVNLPLRGSLTFRNDEYPLEYKLDIDGHAVVIFDGIDGLPEDVDLFWDQVHVAGKSTGRSIAKALRRVPGIVEPRQDELYPTVNPMKFLLKELLGAGLVVVAIRTNDLGAGAFLPTLNFVRQVMPAHVAVLFSSQTSIPLDSYTGGNGDTSEPGVAGFDGAAIPAEVYTAGTDWVEGVPRLRLIET